MPLGVGVATGAAVSFAAADFCGAVVSRRVSSLSAALSVQVISGAGLALLALASGASMTPAAALIGLVAGAAVAIGIFGLYQALAAGAIGVVAIVTGVVASSATLAYDVAIGSHVPSALQLAGIGCAVIGAGFSARMGAVTRPVIALSVVAGLAFAASFIFYNRAAGESAVSVLFWARSSAIVLLGGLWLASAPRHLTLRPLIAIAGVLDTVANALMLAAVTLMPVSLATAISSAEPPVVAMVLARLLLGEGLPRTAYLAVALAALGIALILLG